MRLKLWRWWWTHKRYWQRFAYQVVHYVLFLWPFYCHWHQDDSPVSYNPDPESTVCYAYCPECACMLDTKTCWRCGLDFLDFTAKGSADVMAAPYVTASGDLTCCNCGRRIDEDEEARESEEGEYDYDYDYNDIPDHSY